jgi:WD40 repeat protein
VDSLVNIWQLNTHELHSTLEGHFACVTCVAFSPNGLFAVSGSEDKTARVWGLTLGLVVSAFKVSWQYNKYLLGFWKNRVLPSEFCYLLLLHVTYLIPLSWWVLNVFCVFKISQHMVSCSPEVTLIICTQLFCYNTVNNIWLHCFPHENMINKTTLNIYKEFSKTIICN